VAPIDCAVGLTQPGSDRKMWGWATGSASPTRDAVMRSSRGQSILRRAAISFGWCHQLPPIAIDVELSPIRIPVSPPFRRRRASPSLLTTSKQADMATVAEYGCLIDGGGNLPPSESRWPRWSRCWGCTGIHLSYSWVKQALQGAGLVAGSLFRSERAAFSREVGHPRQPRSPRNYPEGFCD
jgi:hypothetical protein